MQRQSIKTLVLLAWLLTGNAIAQPTGDGGGPLRILVYGATGEVGQPIVAEALERGHLVTAVSRNPLSIEQRHENLSAVAGDLLDQASIESLLQSQDVVIVSVRGIIGDSKTAENALQLIAVRNIVTGLRAMGPQSIRFIHIGGSGSLEVEPGILLADKLPKIFLPQRLEAEIEAQVLALEFLRMTDGIDWSYATPAKRFTNGERTGEFRIGGDTMLRDRRGRSRISRADFAVAIIDEAENAAHLRERFSVAY